MDDGLWDEIATAGEQKRAKGGGAGAAHSRGWEGVFVRWVCGGKAKGGGWVCETGRVDS